MCETYTFEQILAEIHDLEVCKKKKVSNEQIKPHEKLKDIEFFRGKFPPVVNHIVLIYTYNETKTI